MTKDKLRIAVEALVEKAKEYSADPLIKRMIEDEQLQSAIGDAFAAIDGETVKENLTVEPVGKSAFRELYIKLHNEKQSEGEGMRSGRMDHSQHWWLELFDRFTEALFGEDEPTCKKSLQVEPEDPLSQARELMASAAYWREKDPKVIAKVQEIFKNIYGEGNHE